MAILINTLIAASLLTVSVAVLCSQRSEVTRSRSDLAQMQAAVRENEHRIRAHEHRLEQTRRQLTALEARGRARRPRQAVPAGAGSTGNAPEAASASQAALTRGFPNERWSDDTPYVEIAKCNLANLWVTPFGQPSDEKGLRAEFAVAEEALVLLSLTAREQAAVETALTNLAAKFRQIEVTKLHETESPPSWDRAAWTNRYPGAKVYTVGAFAEDAAPLKAEFEQAISAAIGPKRAEVFQQYGQFSFNQKFGDFGRKERSIAFMPPQTRDGQRWFQQVIQCGPDGAFSEMRVSANDPVSRLPLEWQHLFVQASSAE
jgi:hypothetical protein